MPHAFCADDSGNIEIRVKTVSPLDGEKHNHVPLLHCLVLEKISGGCQRSHLALSDFNGINLDSRHLTNFVP